MAPPVSMTKSTRRRFLLASSAATLGIGSTIYYRNRTQMRNASNPTQNTLSAIIDTIVPAAITSAEQKGALDLKIDISIRDVASNAPKFNEQLQRINQAVDQSALRDHQRKFARLDIDQREALLTRILTSAENRQLRIDLTALRNSVMLRYYRSAAGRQHLAYTLPSDYPNY